MIRIEELSDIKKPVVWSLHDMWGFTGGCHYDEKCGKYQSNCFSCPILGSNKVKDLSRYVFSRKRKTYKKLDNLVVIGVSRWLAECARHSSLFADKRVVHIPNPIDTTIFSPFNKVEARRILNLPDEKKIILYGALSATSDSRKGYDELIKAFELIPDKNDIELVVFGNSSPVIVPDGLVVHSLGYIDEVSLRLLYSAADVMVVPSLQEAFGQTASESMACGTPVVAFGATGLLDIVDHKQNGYLAEPFNSTDLARGISWVINSPIYQSLSQNAREKVVRCFDSRVVAKKFIELYASIFEGGGNVFNKL